MERFSTEEQEENLPQISLDDLARIHISEDYKIIRVLSSGSFGKVF